MNKTLYRVLWFLVGVVAGVLILMPKGHADPSDVIYHMADTKCQKEVEEYKDPNEEGKTVVYLGCMTEQYKQWYIRALDQYNINRMYVPHQ